MVAERDRLGRLQMRESRHDRAGVPVGVIEQCRLQGAQASIKLVERVADPQSHGGRHLVVPRTRGVQPLAGRSGDFRQTVFHVHVDVFEFVAPGEGSGCDFGLDLGQTLDDGLMVGRTDQSLALQHLGMRSRLPDVLLPELAVERV